MPATYADQFFTIDPAAPPAVGANLVFERADYTDANDDGLITSSAGDTYNGILVSSVFENDTVTVNVPGVGDITYTGVTFYLNDGSPAVFTPTDGQVLQNGTFVSATYVTQDTQMDVGDAGPTCFTPGTMIDTVKGPVAIETLKVGDLIETLDDGPQPIRQIVSGTFRAVGCAAPVRFETGTIGNSKPLTVSQQHRVLISGSEAELHFGETEVLVAAKHLVNGNTICFRPGGTVRYIHLVFDKHQIIFGQGAPSESFYPHHAAIGHKNTPEAGLGKQLAGGAPDLSPSSVFVRLTVLAREARVMLHGVQGQTLRTTDSYI